jgi:hypothetical protein
VTPGPPAGRRSRGALRALLVEAGVDILFEEGLGIGAGNLTLQRVFDRLEEHQGVRVTHASVLGRIWPSQADFQRDVLAVLADDDGAQVLADTVERLTPALAAADRSTPEARRATVAELCRVGCQASLDANTTSREWRVWTAVWALAMTVGDPDPAIAQALQRSFDVTIASYRYLYEELTAFTGLRLRAPFTLTQFTTLATALAEGCSIRDLIDISVSRGVDRPSGPDGEQVPWTLFGIALDALVQEFFEFDPDWVASAPATDPDPGPMTRG